MRLFIFLASLLSVNALAEISGPTTSTTGSFNLSWTFSGSTLNELDTTGNVINTWNTSPATITKPDGTYLFQEWGCINLPFMAYTCFEADTYQVIVNTAGTSGTSYPESAKNQAKYIYTFRSGDFNNDGRVDILVDRDTAGPADGSMQPYIVYQYGNGALSAEKPTTSQLATARSYPIDSTLNLMPSDFNMDGYVDHIIENMKAVLGSNVVDEYIIFAAGIASDKTKPLGSAKIDDEFKSFLTDLGQWLNDDSYFTDNISTTEIPIYSVGFGCGSSIWFDSLSGHLFQRFCFPTFHISGYRTVQTGVNLSALSASSVITSIYNNLENISNDDLWQLSEFAKTIFNVHSFGFDDSGIRHTTNHSEETVEDEKAEAIINFSYMIMGASNDIVVQQPNVTHDYTQETEICSTNEAFCNLANIACWGRHFHAPLENEADHETPVENGDTSDLTNTFNYENEIRTGVGSVAGLPPNAIANVTEPNHILHDLDGPDFGTCPKPVSGQGSGPTNECSQVYREPFVSGGKIKMRTRGFGDNPYAIPNQLAGPFIFKRLDKKMKKAIESAADGLCPSL